MGQSILESVKKMNGIAPESTDFDLDIITHINSVFAVLRQIGAAPPEGFFIEDAETAWEEFIEDPGHINMVKSYMALKVRQLFDPPSTSFTQQSLADVIKELEVRLNYEELVFNPDAYEFVLQNRSGTVWVLENNEPFPEEAENGDIGFDPISGNVWRNVE